MRNFCRYALPILSQLLILITSLFFWIFSPNADVKLWVLALVVSVLAFVLGSVIYVLFLKLDEAKKTTNYILSDVVTVTVADDNLTLLCKDPSRLYNTNSMASIYETTNDDTENFLCTAYVTNRSESDIVYFRLVLSEPLSEAKADFIKKISTRDKTALRSLLVKPTISWAEFNKGGK